MDTTKKVLLVYPRFPGNNLLNYEYMVRQFPGIGSVLPPLGMLTFAGLLNERFNVRLVDENVRELCHGDLEWAEIVALSGMHPQQGRIDEIVAEANAMGRITVLGGPSVNICPEYYPNLDALHVGELGDATDRLVEWLATTEGKPEQQQVFEVVEKTPLDDQPLPRFGVLRSNSYLCMSVQLSVGCPFTCEFCDIPVIYGRVARFKNGERVVRELQAIYDSGFIGSVVFVDDNIIANRKSLRATLEQVIAWQKANGYPYPLSAESTINLARDTKTLAMLQEARLTHMFIGVETPEPETLLQISKKQNTHDPMIDSLKKIQSYGIEILMGMILGFDGDTENSGQAMRDFIDDSNAPIVYFNLLAALPKTPLWERIQKEGRLLTDPEGDSRQSSSMLSGLRSNIDFKLPNELVAQMLVDTVAHNYSADEVYRRYRYCTEEIYAGMLTGVPPVRTWGERFFLIGFTLLALARVVWKSGVVAGHRMHFWRYLGFLLKQRWRGHIASVIEVLLRTVPMAYHLIKWGQVLQKEAATLPSRATSEKAPAIPSAPAA